ncbi:UROS [Branchiostoma lanceolatum]|uniref:Uroporphyrinogen-III synthase n=1 Tax=Branchiostoma lanceolatum TaxID=7740 RepID=A0A8J9ZPZ3_BRALA|nr:UROS [Branchiostoma lanceolatum]
MGILLLREPREGRGTDPYEQEFLSAGMQVKSIEVLSFEFCNLPELRSLLNKPEEFSGMVFTSQRSVEAVRRCLQDAEDEEQSLPGDWICKSTFVVGTATAAAARSLGLTPSGEECGTATQLADLITQKFPTNGKALLFPCGLMRTETLPSALSAANIPLTELRVYQTTSHPDIDKRLDAYITEQGVPEFLVFFSPSGVKFSQPALQKLAANDLSKIKIAAIGPTTAEAMTSAGLAVACTAEKPNPRSLLTAIQANMAAQPTEGPT